MTAVASHSEHAVFAANRATGTVALDVGANAGRSRRTRVHEDGSLRVRFPNTETGAPLEAVILNTAGGMAGGDRFSFDVAVGRCGALTIGTAAAEKIYRSTGPDTEISLRLSVGSAARLSWLPQETIVFDRARLSRCIDVDLADDASLVLCEAVVFGRTAMGEIVEHGGLIDRWRVRRDSKLVFAETMRLEGGIAGKLAQSACAKGAAALATLLIAPGDEAVAETVRALGHMGEVGVSAWNGMVVARFCAIDGAALRHDIINVLAAFNRAALPRLWLS
jgi:urease accessory protein